MALGPSPAPASLCMVRPVVGNIAVILNLRPTSGWAVVLVSVAALSLAGCGRKGGLDLPPSASGAPNAPVALDNENDAAAKARALNSSYTADEPPPPTP